MSFRYHASLIDEWKPGLDAGNAGEQLNKSKGGAGRPLAQAILHLSDSSACLLTQTHPLS
jgi:hypothetical protein